MKNLSLVELANKTASSDPVPGGGSIAAVCGSLSGALTEMVAGLTIGKKKYIEVESEMITIKEKALNLRVLLLDDIAKDSDAFTLVMDAFGMAKSTDEEKALRSKAIQDGLKEASRTPLSVASKAYEIMELSAVVVAKGNKNAKTDGLVSLMLGRTAVLSALLNVQINLDSIKDEDFVADMSKDLRLLKDKAVKLESEVLEEFSII